MDVVEIKQNITPANPKPENIVNTLNEPRGDIELQPRSSDVASCIDNSSITALVEGIKTKTQITESTPPKRSDNILHRTKLNKPIASTSKVGVLIRIMHKRPNLPRQCKEQAKIKIKNIMKGISIQKNIAALIKKQGKRRKRRPTHGRSLKNTRRTKSQVSIRKRKLAESKSFDSLSIESCSICGYPCSL